MTVKISQTGDTSISDFSSKIFNEQKWVSEKEKLHRFLNMDKNLTKLNFKAIDHNVLVCNLVKNEIRGLCLLWFKLIQRTDHCT